MRGISPIVAVVLLIAISVIATVGVYYWVGSLTKKQATPETPGVLQVIRVKDSEPVKLLVQNIGGEQVKIKEMHDTIGLPSSGGSITYYPTPIGTLKNGSISVSVHCRYDGQVRDLGPGDTAVCELWTGQDSCNEWETLTTSLIRVNGTLAFSGPKDTAVTGRIVLHNDYIIKGTCKI